MSYEPCVEVERTFSRFFTARSRRAKAFLLAACLLPLTIISAPSLAQESNDTVTRTATRAKPTGSILVKWRKQTRSADGAVRAQKAASLVGRKMRSTGQSGDLDALEPEDVRDERELQAIAASLERDPDVEFASVEYWRQAQALTNDPLLSDQWYLLSAQPAATRTEAAWDITHGSASVIVAVLDTGVRPDHPDLAGKLLPGRDFISIPLVANDGNGRDNDPSDPGDFVTLADVNASPNDPINNGCIPAGFTQRDSSWHGTRVAGLIGAQTNNATGIAGNAWNTMILPVRVLGKCGGRDLDIMDGMRWAAGITVDGVENPNPAQVINLSLGGEGPCTFAYQATINDVLARGALIVASAGNDGDAVSAPANCQGVLGVGAIRHAGTKVGFSNLGPQVGISAPGGNCVNTGINQPCLFSIIVTTNLGQTTPGQNTYTDQFNANYGTSFSAPLVSSAAALVRAVNGSLTPAQAILLLKETAMPFPVNPSVATCTVPTSSSAPQLLECNCTTSTCGAGMLNTGAAVAAALKPLAVVVTSGTVAPGATINLDGTSSFAPQGRSIAAHQWSVTNFTGDAPTLTSTSGSTTSLKVVSQGSFTIRLTVTDNSGEQGTREIELSTGTSTPTPNPNPPPPSPGITGGGGGGGGRLSGGDLLGLGLLAGLARRRRRVQSAV